MAYRSDRGYSSKVQQLVKRLEKETRGGGEGRAGGGEGRREVRNWRECSQRELERIGPVARSRYLAVSYIASLFFIIIILLYTK